MRRLDRRAALKVGMAGLAYGATFSIARAAPIKLKLGNDLPATHSVNIRLTEAIQAIAAETHGEVEVSLFPNNQLGNDKDMISQLRSGALELATMPNTVLSTLVPQSSLVGLGYAFTSYDKVWAAMDGEVGAHLRGLIAKAGLTPFEAAWDNGFRQITSSTHPINAPEDLANFKIRVPVVPLWVSMFSAFGAAPVSIPLAEAYSALQTKIADGQENPLVLIDNAKFYEVQKYVSMTRHSWVGIYCSFNMAAWKKLPPPIQDTIGQHITEAATAQRADWQKLDATEVKTLQDHGMQFNTPEIEPFRALARKNGFYADMKKRMGDEAWALLEKYTGKLV